MKIKTLKKIKNLENKKVLVRVGFDCPIKNGKIIDDSRIRQILPTINYLIKKKAKIILISHLGRPLDYESIRTLEHKNMEIKKKFSLLPVYRYLRNLKLPVKFVNDCLGLEVEKAAGKMRPGQVILLENLRFYPGEEKNDDIFAKKLSALADIYVNEAFSASHRKNASLVAINKYLPGYAGLLLEKEIKYLSSFLKNSKHPLIVLMGGKKIETKIKPIKNLLKKADKVLVGGSLASNFFKARNDEIGQSFYEPSMLPLTKELLKNKKIILPVDVKIMANKKINVIDILELRKIKKDFEIFDIGPKTVKMFEKCFKNAKMIFWNGPMGYFEERRFRQGTISVAQKILKNKKAKIVIGGGETLIILKNLKLGKNVFVSSGGGAMLEFMEGKVLPGIRPLLGK
ncbi:MAG: phosphoglycerate kinase [Patescibacteria group bacterium]|jgi:3-phosphoglycerate kinase|nr:phosphoglycerate kinase [Patescibacteria group bacterium]MDD5172976.1 phosphoglycerate kinase [Patescibacteria group bacterium]